MTLLVRARQGKGGINVLPQAIIGTVSGVFGLLCAVLLVRAGEQAGGVASAEITALVTGIIGGIGALAAAIVSVRGAQVRGLKSALADAEHELGLAREERDHANARAREALDAEATVRALKDAVHKLEARGSYLEAENADLKEQLDILGYPDDPARSARALRECIERGEREGVESHAS